MKIIKQAVFKCTRIGGILFELSWLSNRIANEKNNVNLYPTSEKLVALRANVHKNQILSGKT